MKAKRYRKVIGISLGDRSLLAAEVVAGDKPQVRQLAEMIYPAGASIGNPVELGKALQQFLKEKNFTATTAVVGLPVKWLVVKSKEVPPADDTTLTTILRLGLEAEFPADLKDLIFDFSSESGGRGASRNVMLLGTPKRNIDAAVAICGAAGISVVAVTPSALALGGATSSGDKNVLVLSVASTGAELSVQQGFGSSIIRHLRPPTPEPPFVSELRRTVSMLPKDPAGRDMVLWDSTGIDASSLGEQLGVRINNAELESLGVDSSLTGTNGDGSRFAAAVALALVGIEGTQAVDFLHSRLAAPKIKRVSDKMILAIFALVVLIGSSVFAWQYLVHKEAILKAGQDSIERSKPEIDKANDFVKMASFAQFWHGGDPLYLACLRDVTNAMPNDQQTYATSLKIVAETPKAAAASKAEAAHTLAVTLECKTAGYQNVEKFEAMLKKSPERFVNVQVPKESMNQRENYLMFTISFDYVPPKAVALPAKKAEPTTR